MLPILKHTIEKRRTSLSNNKYTSLLSPPNTHKSTTTTTAISVTRKVLGQGASSLVFLAINTSCPNKPIACKLLCRSPKNDDAIQCEISALRRIKHKNIVELHSTREQDERVMLFLEYIPGEDLHTILLKRKVKPEETKDWMKQILSALYYCHSKWVAHLDVKCENLLLEPTGTVKLIDFGMSCINTEESDGFLCECYRGSPLYMAPEIFDKKPFNPFKTDAWASGIVYYRLLDGGAFPWKSQSFTDLVQEVNEHEVIYPEHFTRNNKVMLDGLLEINSSKRMGIGQALSFLNL